MPSIAHHSFCEYKFRFYKKKMIIVVEVCDLCWHNGLQFSESKTLYQEGGI